MFWSSSHMSVSKSVSQGFYLWQEKWKIRLVIVESREWKPSVLSFKFINKVQLSPLLGFLMNHRIYLDKLINGQLGGAYSFALWVFFQILYCRQTTHKPGSNCDQMLALEIHTVNYFVAIKRTVAKLEELNLMSKYFIFLFVLFCH